MEAPAAGLLVGAGESDAAPAAAAAAGENVDAAVDGRGRTALHLAALGGDEALARELLRRGATVDARDHTLHTPLHLACLGGHAPLAELLLEGGAAADAPNRAQVTALHLAARGGLSSVVRKLLAAGASATAQDNLKESPLHKAAEAGHADVALLLLPASEAAANMEDKFRATPLHKAAERGHTELCTMLLLWGAEADRSDWYRNTPLHRAAKNGHSAAVRQLVQWGATIEARDFHRFTPLDKAVRGRHTGTMAALIELGADVQPEPERGTELLRAVAIGGFSKAVECCLAKGCIDAVGDPGERRGDRTAHIPVLHLAAAANHPQTVATLARQGGGALERRDHDGRLAVHYAAAHGAVDALRELLQLGAASGRSARDRVGATPLHEAVRCGQSAAAQLLVRSGDWAAIDLLRVDFPADAPGPGAGAATSALPAAAQAAAREVWAFAAQLPALVNGARQRLAWASSLSARLGADSSAWQALPLRGDVHALVASRVQTRKTPQSAQADDGKRPREDDDAAGGAPAAKGQKVG